MRKFNLLIDGKLLPGDETMPVVNPATEEILAECPRASRGQVLDAIDAARRAFKVWSKAPLHQRRNALRRIASTIEENQGELSKLTTLETGKPRSDADQEVRDTIRFVRYFAELELQGEPIIDDVGRRIEARRKPLGVVAAITPWNYPLIIAGFKVPPALLAGNTVVIKPAPTTPLSTLRLAELIKDHLPPGVLNVVTDQNDLGGFLTEHPHVRKVSFTGSSETGRKVMRSAAEGLKRLTLELGGNDPAIVLDDVDVKAISPRLFRAAFQNAGQVCLAIKRLYVHDAVYDDICAELARLADEAIVDDGLLQGAEIGPLQNAQQYEKVLGLIDRAKKEGVIVAGGYAMDRPGYFVRPTIVRDIADGSQLVDEEQFGPVLPVVSFSTVEDVVERANASPFGLGASVWSADYDRALGIAQQLDAGTVWINKHLDQAPHIPFGGAKQSGIGTEYAWQGFLEFTQLQIING